MRIREFIRYRLQITKRDIANLPLEEWCIETNESGFTVNFISYRPILTPSNSRQYISWSQIAKIIAYKQDNLTWDTIWLQFEQTDGTSLSVPEEASGWSTLISELPIRVPGCLSAEIWWAMVAQPAFVENATQIFPPPV